MRTKDGDNIRILYLVYWGALEQLGQSLVIPAVKQLSQMGADLTLVTFEKRSDLENEDEMSRVRNILTENNIDWIPLEYHKTPKIPATLFDLTQGIAKGLQKRLKKRFDIVHGRNYIGGLIGVTLASLIRAKFVYHNEGFYPDEQVDGGFWTEDSRPHRIAKKLENLMYARADGIIALSHRARKDIENNSKVKKKQTPVIFVPSCVDLERFNLPERRINFTGNELKLVYIGSIGGRYILDKISKFIATIRNAGQNVTLQIYSKADKELVKRMMAEGGLETEFWSQNAVPYTEMPKTLANYHAGLFFLEKGISEHGCSPTKIGEYWAVGLPIITTSNVSDTDELISVYDSGVIIEQHTEEEYLRAYEELRILLKDKNLSDRCRKAAVHHYALEPACERQFSLYKSITR